MNAMLLAIRVLLALVLAVAGLAKLADRQGSREAVSAFGAGEALAGPIATVLPLAELAAAILLLASGSARIGACLALALFVVFSAAIARSIFRGEAPDCHCFGQLHSAPAGPRTLARNLLLAAGAAVVLAGGPGPSATAWIGRLSGTAVLALLAGVTLVAVVVAGGSFALSLLRRHGLLLLRVESLEQALAEHGIAVPSAPAPASAGLPAGSPAPEFELADLHGAPVTLRSLRGSAGSRAIVLVFTDPGCGPCSALLPQIAAWQRDEEQALRIVVVSRGDREANRAHAREHGLADVLVQTGGEVSERYGVPGTPAAVLIAAEGTIAGPVVAGADAIKDLVAGHAGAAGHAAAPTLTVHHHAGAPGPPAPDLTLGTLDGQPCQLSSRLSGPTVVLFWNPACGFCERMLPDLRAFEQERPPEAPSLLMVSTGEPELNRQMGLSTPILLDQSFAAGGAFGAAGTPSAVLVDADGRVASPIAVGAPAVLALMGVGGTVPVR